MSSNTDFDPGSEVHSMQTKITISLLHHCSSFSLLKENQGEVLVNCDLAQAQPLDLNFIKRHFSEVPMKNSYWLVSRCVNTISYSSKRLLFSW